MADKPIKRFIAGAVCPRCGEMDKLVMYKDSQQEIRECVRCGFKQTMQEQQQDVELETRVNQEQQPAPEDEISVVKLFPAPDD